LRAIFSGNACNRGHLYEVAAAHYQATGIGFTGIGSPRSFAVAALLGNNSPRGQATPAYPTR